MITMLSETRATGNGRKTIDATTRRDATIGRLAAKLFLHECLVEDGMAYSADRGLDYAIEETGAKAAGHRVGATDRLTASALPRPLNRQAAIGRLLTKLVLLDQDAKWADGEWADGEWADGLEKMLDEDLDDEGLLVNALDGQDFLNMLTRP